MTECREDQWADLADGHYRIRVDRKWMDGELSEGFWFIEGRESSLDPEAITDIAAGAGNGRPLRPRQVPEVLTWRLWWKAREEIFAWMLICVLFVATAIAFLARMWFEDVTR